MSGVVTLTTDFSTSDAYVGVMKGVILSISTDIRIVDISHHIPPQDVFAAAFVLKSAYRWFPAGTVQVVVVDPGVGSNRRRLAMRCGEHYFVGPDNGVFTYPIRDQGVSELVEIPAPDSDSRLRGRTFDGRDVFAPAAARIALGAPLADLGPAAAEPVMLDIPRPAISRSAIEGHIIYVDAFGNCVSNIEAADIDRLERPAIVSAEARRVGEVRGSYSEVGQGEPVALINSVDMLEIAINGGSAADQLGLAPGSAVRVVSVANQGPPR